MKNLIKHGSLLGVLLVGSALSLGAQPPQSQDNTGDTNHRMGHHGRHGGQWKAMRQEMVEETKAQDAELQQLLTQMTNAAPAQKLDATSALLGKLVEDRLALHQKLESMHEQMHGTNSPDGTNAPSDQGTGTLPPTP
jgi:Spy/CpxP family protein refolding chaperone